jgi:hypothetical protein
MFYPIDVGKNLNGLLSMLWKSGAIITFLLYIAFIIRLRRAQSHMICGQTEINFSA